MHILLVDDDPDTHLIFTRLSKLCPDVKVRVAETGEEVLNILEVLVPDIVVVDLFLFKEDGYQVLHRIRQAELYSGYPIIATTSYYSTNTRVKVLLSGFDGFIEKPLRPETLIASLQSVINSWQSLEDPT